jgi:4'-phosphopantetheinyl transferase EntD
MSAALGPPAAAPAEAAGTQPGGAGSGPGLCPPPPSAGPPADPRRQAEFTAGRRCAREALARLGLPAAPVPTGRAGEPQWPAGVTGSITHCAGYLACAVALVTDLAAIGIDAEPDDGLPAGLIESLATGAERAWLARQAGAAPMVHWDRLLFSAKEAAAKLWYPLTGRWPGLSELTVFPATDGTFDARVAGSRLTGRWRARGGLIVTAVTWTPGSAERE